MGMDRFQTQASVEQRRPDPSRIVELGWSRTHQIPMPFVDPDGPRCNGISFTRGPTKLKPAGSLFPDDDGWIQNDIIEQS